MRTPNKSVRVVEVDRHDEVTIEIDGEARFVLRPGEGSVHEVVTLDLHGRGVEHRCCEW